MSNSFRCGNQFGRTPRRAIERVLDRVEKVTESGCWIFMGAVKANGYGSVGVGSQRDGTRRVDYAHRVVYEALKGPIASGLELDHLCRVRCCVNPDHLEPVTPRENILRGVLGEKRRSLRCVNGHDLSDPANVYRSSRVGRTRFECRTCLRSSEMARRLRRAEVGA